MNDIQIGDVVCHKGSGNYAKVHNIRMDSSNRNEVIEFGYYTKIGEGNRIIVTNPSNTSWYMYNLRLATNREVTDFERKLEEHLSNR